MIKPKTRKEKLLSAIANDTPVPIQPKNREELFLAQIAEKTSNVPKPLTYDYMPEGYPKVGYGTATLFDQTVTVDSDGVYESPSAGLEFVTGNTYFVTYKDTKYECVSYSLGQIIAIGNGALAGGSGGNNEPFCIATQSFVDEGETFVFLMMTFSDAAGEDVDVKIEGPSEVSIPIAYEFMPEGYPSKVVSEEVLFDQTVEGFAEDGGMYVVELTDATFELVAGDKYTVTWDGVEYTDLIAAALDEVSAFIGADPRGEITEELPFCISFSSEYGNSAITIHTATSHTVSITHIGEVVTPMDYDFMPEGYPKKETVIYAEEQTVQFSGGEGFINAITYFSVGDSVTVVWDGVTYECTAAMFAGSSPAVGNQGLAGGTDTGEPFLILCDAGEMVALSQSETAVVSIFGTKTTPMAEEFLPAASMFACTIDGERLVRADGEYATTEEVRAAIASNKLVYAFTEEGNYYTYFPICARDNLIRDGVTVHFMTDDGTIFSACTGAPS